METLTWSQPEQTQQWVHAFVKELQRPCVILLSGDLGVGKTQLVKWFLHEMGVADVSSPTFAIHQQYQNPSGAIDHVDLYRLKSDADLESSGFWDLLAQPSGLVFVEWADRLPESAWPQTWQKIFIHLEKRGNDARVAQVKRL